MTEACAKNRFKPTAQLSRVWLCRTSRFIRSYLSADKELRHTEQCDTFTAIMVGCWLLAVDWRRTGVTRPCLQRSSRVAFLAEETAVFHLPKSIRHVQGESKLARTPQVGG